LLCTVTVRPPAGAGSVRDTTPLTGFPPTTALTDNVTPATATLAETGTTANVAEAEVPFALALIDAVTAPTTTEVFTTKAPVVWPAAIEMVDGTCAALLLLWTATVNPPAGEGPLSVTTPFTGLPPITVLAERLTPVTVTEAERGVMVRLADEEELLYVAVTMPVVMLLTLPACTEKNPDALPPEMKTVAGTVIAAMSAVKLIVAPPAGAALLKVTVPAAELPEGVVDGLMLKLATVVELLFPSGFTVRMPEALDPPADAVTTTCTGTVVVVVCTVPVPLV